MNLWKKEHFNLQESTYFSYIKIRVNFGASRRKTTFLPTLGDFLLLVEVGGYELEEILGGSEIPQLVLKGTLEASNFLVDSKTPKL